MKHDGKENPLKQNILFGEETFILRLNHKEWKARRAGGSEGGREGERGRERSSIVFKNKNSIQK